jgi:hypothetical protein
MNIGKVNISVGFSDVCPSFVLATASAFAAGIPSYSSFCLLLYFYRTTSVQSVDHRFFFFA